ncbi:MAG: putative porin [Bacteroidales bacterium]|jgi:hypothetical protein|nr:putative porin [Bacteroidales bacterium]
MYRLFHILLFVFMFSGMRAQEDTLQPASEQDSTFKKMPQKVPLNNIAIVRRESALAKPQADTAANVSGALTDDGLTAAADSANKPRVLEQWTLSRDFIAEEQVVFDTLFSLSNRYRAVDLYSPVNALLGNYGLPYYPVNFFDRISDSDMFLYSGLYHLMHTSGNTLFTNVQIPFTELKWTIAGQKDNSEQTFRVKHSQNVNSKFNFGLIFDVVFSLGQYTAQRSEDKTFTFYTSYRGNRYKLYLSAGINNLSGQENGGIVDKNDLGISTNITDLRSIPVRLGTMNMAKSVLKNKNFLAVQRYTFMGTQLGKNVTLAGKTSPVSGTFSHIFQIDDTKRTYYDAAPGSGFYDSVYINSQLTLDSISSRSVKNTFRFDFTANVAKSLRYTAGFGLRNENFWFGQIIPTHDTTTVADTASWFRGNNVLLGRFENYMGENFRWSADGELFIDRYRKGDYVLNGLVAKSFDLSKEKLDLIFTGRVSGRTPSFWYNQWGGNNFEWHNSFNREMRTEFGAKAVYPARNLNIRFNYAIIDNYVDFDTLALPAQYGSTLAVMSAAVGKDFRLWKFHLAPDINIQKSNTPEILDLPLATIKTAAYFEHMFHFKSTNGRLYTQFGVDVVYHTPYHAYSYMPATGRFYRQLSSETGNYPFVNAFINMKIKRARFFFMFDHVNHRLMPPGMMYNYEMIPQYPWNARRFTFGIAWTFYN